MPKVKLNIRGLSIPERIARARQIVDAMTGNPAFPTPQPPLNVVITAIDSAETAYADAQAAKQAAITSTTVSHDSDAAMEIELRKLGAYVESVASDEQTIQSAAMGVAGSGGPLLQATNPTGLTASEGDHDATLDLHYDRVKGAKSYVIEQSLDPPTATSWAHAAVSSKSSVTISGLVSGTRYWFRVAAVTSSGQSGWSDPATKIAP
jgi:hypothetical protein